MLSLSRKVNMVDRLVGSIRDIVFGLEDGLVSTVGVLTGIAAGTCDYFVIILSGFVFVVVTALSMGVGSFLSSQSESDLQKRRAKDMKDMIISNPKKAKEILFLVYKKLGLKKHERDHLLRKAAKDHQFWQEELNMHYLGISKLADYPVLNAMYMFVAYVLGGSIPILPYFFFPIETAILLSVPFTVIALFIVGSLKGRLAYKSWWKSGLTMALLCFSVALLGYVTGQLVDYFFHVKVS